MPDEDVSSTNYASSVNSKSEETSHQVNFLNNKNQQSVFKQPLKISGTIKYDGENTVVSSSNPLKIYSVHLLRHLRLVQT